MLSGEPTVRPDHQRFTCSAVRPKLAQSGWRETGATQHFVQVYERDETLLAALTDYVLEGLRKNECVILICTAPHAQAVEACLRTEGADPAAASRARRLYVLDADSVLARFMIGGMPDPALFDIAVGSLVRAAGRQGRPVRAYGEMVALLVAAGNATGALRLEELWNALGTQARFSLFCAYPASCFHGPDGDRLLRDVCHTHARVIPVESFAA